jgi:opacity protein-like surface antigen
MTRTIKSIFILMFVFVFSSTAAAGGFFLGIQGGYSSLKPSLEDIEFNSDTTFLYGAKAGFKLMMMAVEANLFRAAHNIKLKEFAALEWEGQEVDYVYLGLNVKVYFSLLILQPYLTVGYGFYTADINTIDKDTDKGLNLGLGVEIQLGRKFSVLAEGKYHRVSLDIDSRDLKLGDFTLTGGLIFYF